jgi:hypothetical protein
MNKPTFGTFRGWSTEGDEWVYGFYSFQNERFFKDDGIPEDFDGDYDDLLCEGDNMEFYIKVSNSLTSHYHHLVHPESLAMFTGRLDAEDKPIYGNIPLPGGSMSRGGDIVVIENDTNQERYIVEFRVSGFHICPVKTKSHIRIISNLDELKVIGNAYENPELLEAKS